MADNTNFTDNFDPLADTFDAFRDHYDEFDDNAGEFANEHHDGELGSHDSHGPVRPDHTIRVLKTRRHLALGGLIIGGAAALMLAAFYGLWAYDVHNHDVVRNVTIAGRPVGGLSPDKLRAALSNLDAEYKSTKVHITTPEGVLETTAGDLGVGVDIEKSFAATLAVGHRGAVLPRAWDWVGTIAGADHVVPIPVTVNSETFTKTITDLEKQTLVLPIEPTVALNDNDQFVVTPGTPGSGLDVRALAASIPTSLGGAAKGFQPLSLTASRQVVAPNFSDATAKSLADQANDVATTSLTIVVNGNKKTINPHRVRSWLMPLVGPQQASLGINNDLISKQLSGIFDGAAEPGGNAKVFIDDNGKVAYKEGTTGHGCCADAPNAILDALKTHTETPISLELHVVPPALTVADLQKLGVKEIVGEATTFQACCGNRQKNIHKIADASNGWLVMPGDTFSLNAVTGERRLDNGWFMAAGIEGAGGHKPQPGGGVSQYTTTLFNAAFKAGLPVRGQAHTVHFDRYPYGIEATLSYPGPDLKFTNNTPYAILIWNSYTNDSVTAQLWSTKFATGVAAAPQIEKRELCELWTIIRTTTFVSDGHKETDRFSGTYYPDGAANCKGDPAPKYDDNGNPIPTTTTTTLPGGVTTVDPNASTTTTAPGATSSSSSSSTP